ncbi:MAG: histidine kinase dimerization/phospho-acceptor domain-containing protein [Pseudomonadota bacterium]
MFEHLWQIVLVSLAYLSTLFAIAYLGDRRAERGRSPLANPVVYALAIAVYCTSWTYYGSVGLASQSGLGFLPIYLGPTLAFALGYVALKKIVRVAKTQRITSIADFIGARYGKSQLLAGLVTVVAVTGTVPYIALQLKAVATTVDILHIEPAGAPPPFLLRDGVMIVAGVLAIFAVLFGARHIDATENHPGVAAAIAFESLLKLSAFVALGIFVTFGVYGGFTDLFGRAMASPELARLLTFDAAGPSWMALTVLSGAAIFCLPRQFQMTVVGNTDERHLDTAIWLFPLYLLLINVFVLPIAIAGRIAFPDGSFHPDSFVLALPMAHGADLLAVFVFLGGLSAATAMVIVEAIALSIMVSNDIVMPLLLRLRLAAGGDVTRLLLRVRRLAIVGILMLSYGYFRLLDLSFGLVSIGLVAFVAVAQFAPALFAAVFWRGGTNRGAIVGIAGGFGVWLYTLFLPSLANDAFDQGAFGIALLAPHALFGLGGLDPISHGLFWSMVVNVGGFVSVSLFDRPSTIETTQATLFIECLDPDERPTEPPATTLVPLRELEQLAERFVGASAAARAMSELAEQRGRPYNPDGLADRDTIQAIERLIAGAIGAASARVAIASAVRHEGASTDAILKLLDETSQVFEYSRRLEQKSLELVKASEHLKQANDRLLDLDRMKDEFMSTVTHELRTPLTAIRAFSELLYDEPDMPADQRGEFLGHVIRESERLTRLVNQVLDVAKMESGRDLFPSGCRKRSDPTGRNGRRFGLGALPGLPVHCRRSPPSMPRPPGAPAP